MSILESTKGLVESRRKWLVQAEEALRRVEALPESIQNLPGIADVNNDGLDVTIYNGKENLHIVAQEGAELGAATLANWNGKWFRMGRLGDANITVHEVDAPPTCRVVAKQVEVTRYESECKENDVSNS